MANKQMLINSWNALITPKFDCGHDKMPHNQLDNGKCRRCFVIKKSNQMNQRRKNNNANTL